MRSASVVRSLAVIAFLLGGCSEAPAPFEELYELGIDRYVGTPEVEPVSSEPVPSLTGSGEIYVHRFADPASGVRGPICMRGAPYTVETEDGSSDELLIFLQGGGVCLTDVCIATDTVISLGALELLHSFGAGGVLDRLDPDNPFANHDLVYLPYCDGSIFAGDVDRDLRGSMAYQRGLLNLTAAIGIAAQHYPRPSRIVIAGTSGGAYGVLPAAAVARRYYPRSEILVLADSGSPIGQDQDVTFMRRAMEEMNADYLPPSCPDCVADGHLTGLVRWALDRDPRMRVAAMFHASDAVIGEDFMRITQPQMRTGVIREAIELTTAYPGRAHAFVLEGSDHTFILDMSGVPQAVKDAFFGKPLGGMDEAGIDATGATVTAWEWVTRWYDDPTVPNVIPAP